MYVHLHTINSINELMERCKVLVKEAEKHGMTLQARHLTLIIKELEIINRKILNSDHMGNLDIN